MSYWLKYRGTKFPVRRGETIIGRSAYCSIVLSNHLASRQHCALRWTPDGLGLTDLGSKNGTTVNGERVEGERLLAIGDVIRIGTDVLEVVEGESRVHREDRQTTSGSEQASDENGFEDSSTGTHGYTLELVEALVASASQTQNPASLATPIQGAIDGFLARCSDSRGSISRVNAARLRATIETVAAWFGSGEQAEWREAALGAVTQLEER